MASLDASSWVAALRGLRNGAFYGTKIRAPHAFVMTFLFQSGSFRSKLERILSMTFTHTKNLALFVGLYKVAVALGRVIYKTLGLPLQGGHGMPAAPWHAFASGAVAAWFVWADYSGVNFQIVMYLLSRILIAAFKVLAAKKVEPFASFSFAKVYPWLATGVWAVVMYQFENHRGSLHRSLARSMDFLYHDSNSWSAGLSDFLPSPATAVVLLWFYFLRQQS